MGFAKTHKRAGKYLMEHQLVQLKLNEMHALTEALRSYVMRVAWQHDHGEHSANAGLVMNWSTDVIQRVTRLNMEIHGAEGCMMNRARGQAGARRDGVDAPRRRHGAAGQGPEAPRQGVAGDGGRQRRLMLDEA